MGLLCVDGSGTQFFSSLEPLSKEQAQRIKTLQGESKGQLRARECFGSGVLCCGSTHKLVMLPVGRLRLRQAREERRRRGR